MSIETSSEKVPFTLNRLSISSVSKSSILTSYISSVAETLKANFCSNFVSWVFNSPSYENSTTITQKTSIISIKIEAIRFRSCSLSKKDSLWPLNLGSLSNAKPKNWSPSHRMKVYLLNFYLNGSSLFCIEARVLT